MRRICRTGIDLDTGDGFARIGPGPRQPKTEAMVIYGSPVLQNSAPRALDQAVIAKRFPAGMPAPLKSSFFRHAMAGDRSLLAVGFQPAALFAPEEFLCESGLHWCCGEDLLDSALTGPGIFLPEIEIRAPQRIHQPFVMPVIRRRNNRDIVSVRRVQNCEVRFEGIVQHVASGAASAFQKLNPAR